MLEILDFASGTRTVVGPYLDPRVAGPEGRVYGVDLNQGPAILTPPKRLTATPAPRISGVAAVGRTLTAHVKHWKPAPVKLHYQWYAQGKRIAGVTSRKLHLTAKQIGKRITVRVTGARTGYLTVIKESAKTHRVKTG